MKKLLISLLMMALVAPLFGQRISVSGTEFRSNGSRIWINGANTPWIAWNDFGGSFNYTNWGNEFQRMANADVNATRVWISCNGDGHININSGGYVSGPTQAFWDDVDDLFQIAQSYEIHLMIAFISFDHTKSPNTDFQAWRNMYASASNRASFVNNYVVPFINRYKNNPYFWAVDVGNEIDWTFENHGINRANTLDLIARVANAVHGNSDVLVTSGFGTGPKYLNSDYAYANGGLNLLSDASLGSYQSGAYLDFYKLHYYEWMDPYFGNPFDTSPAQYNISEKPVIVGEFGASGAAGYNPTQNYQRLYDRGYQGGMAWTSNGVDSYGDIDDFKAATQAMFNNYPNLIFPSGSGGGSGSDLVLQAEDGTLTGVSVGTTAPGYQGSGHILANTFNDNGDRFSVTANLASAGTHSLKIRYQAGQNKYNYLWVNGANQGEVYFPQTSGWSEVTVNGLAFNAGNNTIELRKSWGWIDVDAFTVVGAGSGSGGGSETLKVQTEDGTLTGVSTTSTGSGYEGAGYIDGGTFNDNGDKVSVTVTLNAAGTHNLRIRFSAPFGTKYNDLYVNGNSLGQVQFNSNSGWTTVTVNNVNFNSGNNTVEIRKSWGWVHLDSIEVVK